MANIKNSQKNIISKLLYIMFAPMFQSKVGSVFMPISERNRSSIGYTAASKEIYAAPVVRPVIPGPKPFPSKSKIEERKRTLSPEAARVIRYESQIKPYLMEKKAAESTDDKIKRLLLADLIEKQAKRNQDIKRKQQLGLISKEEATQTMIPASSQEQLLRQAAQLVPSVDLLGFEQAIRQAEAQTTPNIMSFTDPFEELSRSMLSSLRAENSADSAQLDILTTGTSGPSLGMSAANQERLARGGAEESKEAEIYQALPPPELLLSQEEYDLLTEEQKAAYSDILGRPDPEGERNLNLRRFIDARRRGFTKLRGGGGGGGGAAGGPLPANERALYVSLGFPASGNFIGGESTKSLLQGALDDLRRGEVVDMNALKENIVRRGARREGGAAEPRPARPKGKGKGK